MKIFVIGGARSMAVYISLLKSYESIKYFRNLDECKKMTQTTPDVLILDEDLRENDRFCSLRSIDQFSSAHIIYMSEANHFSHIVKAFKLGASDYIIKDAYLYYSINRSVDRLLRLTSKSEGRVSNYDCRETSAIKNIYPFRFKIYQWLSRF